MIYKCKYCGKEFDSKHQLAGHTAHCKLNPNYEKNLKQLEEARKKIVTRNHFHKNELCECQYCHKQYKLYGLKNHEKYCKYNPNKQTENNQYNLLEYNNKRSNGEITTWNKGLSKETDDRILKVSILLKDGYKSGRIKKSQLTEEGRKRIQIAASKCGGYKKNAGHGKHGWYKGIWCDSSWELAFVIYHLENNLFIKRCNEFRIYEYNNKKYKYYPDFITDKGIFEIKGYCDNKSKIKHLQHPDIKMLYYDDMKIYLNYVIDKYGRDFIKLYDKNGDVSPLSDTQLKE